DRNVTGFQTCALPISMLLEACSHEVQVHSMLHQSHVKHHWMSHVIWQQYWDTLVTCCSFWWSWKFKDSQRVIQMFQGYQEWKVRSEERRVGKERGAKL